MAKDFSKILNVANDFYNGAVKGTKKASWTVNKVASKNKMAKNLDVNKTINKSKKVISNTQQRLNVPSGSNLKVKANNINRTPRKQPFEMKASTAATAGNWAGGGIRDSIKQYKKATGDDKSILGAIQKGHKKVDKAGNLTEKYDMGKIAGTTFSVGVAGRIATGGGLYKDKYGNTNLPGIPFI